MNCAISTISMFEPDPSLPGWLRNAATARALAAGAAPHYDPTHQAKLLQTHIREKGRGDVEPASTSPYPRRQARGPRRISVRPFAGEPHQGWTGLLLGRGRRGRRRPHDRRADAHAGRHRRGGALAPE